MGFGAAARVGVDQDVGGGKGLQQPVLRLDDHVVRHVRAVIDKAPTKGATAAPEKASNQDIRSLGNLEPGITGAS